MGKGKGAGQSHLDRRHALLVVRQAGCNNVRESLWDPHVPAANRDVIEVQELRCCPCGWCGYY